MAQTVNKVYIKSLPAGPLTLHAPTLFRYEDGNTGIIYRDSDLQLFNITKKVSTIFTPSLLVTDFGLLLHNMNFMSHTECPLGPTACSLE